MSNFDRCKTLADRCRKESSKRLIGQSHVIDGILAGILSGGHVLLEGVPGLAKTLAVKTFADISGLQYKRIQFTPDLLPSDITGTLMYEQKSGSFLARKGPVFTNILLADEINRAPAKVQSALLEAMGEKQVTIGDESYALPSPFFVLATQNPVEQDGTYNLPEAELDRFLLKIKVDYPSLTEEALVVKSCGMAALKTVESVFTKDDIKDCVNLLCEVSVDDSIVEYIVSLVSVTRPEKNDKKNAKDFLRYISFGCSPRAGIALLKCAKIHALFEGRDYVLPDDVKAYALPVLRHRLILSYEATADGISADEIIEKILSFVPVP